ncbi:MAG: S8 family serine peptidase [Rickettsiales bacterium]|jgi:hypothetical protein|nr:S8 family serine peptidase [Rickettsiales bacterium]
MKLFKGIFALFLLALFCTPDAFAARPQYRQKSAESSDFLTILLGGLALGAGGFLLATSASGGDSVPATSMPTMTAYGWTNPLEFMSRGGISNYNRNAMHYDKINLAESLARGLTGAGSQIAILDSGNLHGAAAAYAAGSSIAPDAEIHQYKISGDNGKILYSLSAAAIASAQTERIFNASWGVSANDINAAEIYSRAQLANLRDSSGASAAEMLDQISAAATGRDAIFVWAAGNDGTDQSGAFSALPLVMPELSGHFVNVVAYDTAAGALADFSNSCGITQNYCIAAPGVDIRVQVNGVGYVVEGTSFAAPMVSGAIAVIAQAFPYMDSAAITQLLFTTAQDLGDAGVDEVYGWGLLDMEAATRPVGAMSVPLANGGALPLGTARVSGALGRKLAAGNLQFAYLDEFGRAFSAPLSQHIQLEERGRGFQKLRDDKKDNLLSFGNFGFGLSNDDSFSGTGFLQTENNNPAMTAGMRNSFVAGGIEFFQSAKFWAAIPRAAENSVITGFSNVYSAQVGAGATWNDWSFAVGLPKMIVAGSADIRLPTGRAADGALQFADYKLDLRESPAVEYEISWHGLSATYIDNKDFRDEFIFIAKTKIGF